jgi:hypothetical protein
MTKFRNFNKPPSASTIVSNIEGYAYRREKDIENVPDKELIKEWQYTALAKTYLAYPDKIRRGTKRQNQIIGQFGNDSYRSKLSSLLTERGLMEDAESSFSISLSEWSRNELHSNCLI